MSAAAFPTPWNDAQRFPADDRLPGSVVPLLPSITADLSAVCSHMHEDRQGLERPHGLGSFWEEELK